MKKIIVTSFVLFFLFTNSGCVSLSNWGLKQDRQEIAGELSRKEGELNRHTRSYISGTVDALSISQDKSKEDLLALNLAQKAQEIVGLPQPGDKIHVEDLVNENETAFDNLADRGINIKIAIM